MVAFAGPFVVIKESYCFEQRAALRIQTAFRCYRARHEVRERAASAIQAAARPFLKKRQSHSHDHEALVQSILQKGGDLYDARAEEIEKKQKINKLCRAMQRMARRYVSRHESLENDNNHNVNRQQNNEPVSSPISSANPQSDEVEAQSVVKLQALVRGHHVRSRMIEKIRSGELGDCDNLKKSLVRNEARALLDSVISKVVIDIREESVIRIQKSFRGVLARERVRREVAVNFIQAFWWFRRYNKCRHVDDLWHRAQREQVSDGVENAEERERLHGMFGMWFGRMRVLTRRRRAATLIQAFARRNNARGNYLDTMDAVRRIQRSFRSVGSAHA